MLRRANLAPPEQPNVIIKVPATGGTAGDQELTGAASTSTSRCCSRSALRAGDRSVLRRLTARAAEGAPLEAIASVASFFVSRIDTKATRALPADSPLRGRSRSPTRAIAYQRYLTSRGTEMGTAPVARSPGGEAAVG